jgi:hypothetical protein
MPVGEFQQRDDDRRRCSFQRALLPEDFAPHSIEPFALDATSGLRGRLGNGRSKFPAACRHSADFIRPEFCLSSFIQCGLKPGPMKLGD